MNPEDIETIERLAASAADLADSQLLHLLSRYFYELSIFVLFRGGTRASYHAHEADEVMLSIKGHVV
jgi:hypothetical protein